MKRDLLVGVVVILIVCALSFGLVSTRHLQPPQPSPAVVASATGAEAAASPKAIPGTVIMRVNGEPVTDREFALFVQSLPEQMQAYAMNPSGRRAIANQIVQMKVVEQEARKLGAERDPEVAAAMELGRARVFAQYALAKMAANATDSAARAEYEKNKERFAATDLSHILIAYRGGAYPARSGEAPPIEQAMQKANAVSEKLRAGADFGATAREVSDDQNTAPNGGSLGSVPASSLPPEIASVVDKLQPGQISSPVRTQMGVHIFRVMGRHAQSFEEVKPQLQQRAQQTAIMQSVERLQKSARVELDPKFFPPPQQQPKPPQG